jgi:hypothetical protein
MLGFGLNITVELKNKKKLIFDGSGFQEAVCNFFEEWASVEISPKQLALAPSVDELINLLTNNVCDGNRMIFKSSRDVNALYQELLTKLEKVDNYDELKKEMDNLTFDCRHLSSVMEQQGLLKRTFEGEPSPYYKEK